MESVEKPFESQRSTEREHASDNAPQPAGKKDDSPKIRDDPQFAKYCKMLNVVSFQRCHGQCFLLLLSLRDCRWAQERMQ